MRQVIAAGFSGLLLVLAFPRFDLGPVAFFALVPFLFALYGERPQKAFGMGLLTGCLFYLVSLSWMTHTMTVYGGLSWPVSVLVLFALAFYLSLYFALFALLFAKLQDRSGLFQPLFASSLWTALEYLRTYLLTGFPWNLLGYSQYRNLPLIQIAAYTGVYGVSFLLVFVNASIAYALRPPFRGRKVLPPLLLSLFLLLSAFGSSWIPLPQPSKGRELRVALLQGNIDQGVKWDPAYQRATLEAYRRLTLEAAKENPALIVWPETATPFFLRSHPLGEEVLQTAQEARAFLLVGSPDWDGEERRRYFNSAFLISPEGRIVEKYDKIHMVPFGEYVPLKRILFFVQKMAYGIGDFSGGDRYTVFSFSLGRFSVTICYEAIFPDQVRRFVQGGADFLVNITNDAWFGPSSAPYQHLAMAAFRAVENRVYLIRAANTGISAIVAPTGEIVKATDLFVEAALSGAIRLKEGTTFYTRFGDFFTLSCVASSLAAIFSLRRHHRSGKS
ncbi:MAG: apolipoprotein N-acyltransferase [Candidatus Methylomirabilales bacterium]